MQLCPVCNVVYDDSEEEACPKCGHVPEPGDVKVEALDLKPVFRAPDQTTADLVRALLVSEGIAAYLDSRQVAWFDGVMTMATGYWGDVVVLADQEARAREIIQAYEAAPVTDAEVENAAEDQPETPES